MEEGDYSDMRANIQEQVAEENIDLQVASPGHKKKLMRVVTYMI